MFYYLLCDYSLETWSHFSVTCIYLSVKISDGKNTKGRTFAQVLLGELKLNSVAYTEIFTMYRRNRSSLKD